MSDAGLRVKVKRLLSGAFNPQDIADIFLNVRERKFSGAPVKEVGHFYAHSNDRFKGVVTDEVNEWFVLSRTILKECATKTPLDPMRLPEDFPIFLDAQIKRCKRDDIRRDLRLNRSDVMDTVDELKRLLERNPDGSLHIRSFQNIRQQTVFQYLLSRLIVRPAFTGDDLFADLLNTLLKNGLLEESEKRAFRELQPEIGMFAVSKMHNTTVLLRSGAKVTLRAHIAEDAIEITAPVEITDFLPSRVSQTGTAPVVVSSAMFRTCVNPAFHCDPALLALKENWPDLELRIDRKLAPLI